MSYLYLFIGFVKVKVMKREFLLSLLIVFILSIALESYADYLWTERKVSGPGNWTSITSSSDGMKLAACIGDVFDDGYIYTSLDGGATWIERTTAGYRNWISIASSSDGTKLAACEQYGYVYTSEDGGSTWAERTNAGNRDWISIASSSDGTKLAVCEERGYVCTSEDGGDTWTEKTGTGSRWWSSITSSSDGTKLATCEYFGYIYTSVDSGTTWTQRTSAGSRRWSSITSSSDGTKLAACEEYGYVYTSEDGGDTWTERVGVGSRQWSSITSSPDGTKLAVCAEDDYIYTSQDGGNTWIQRTNAGSRDWTAIASSSDGIKLAACAEDSYVYTSQDRGDTWTQRASAGSRLWKSITSSSDCTKLAVCEENGYIYTSADSGTTWTQRTSAGSRRWSSITSSSDGIKLAACEYFGYIYTSVDSGTTWTQSTGTRSEIWKSITSSSDGTKLAACEDYGYVYTSEDGGDTWTERVAVGSRWWTSIASSIDCQKIAACTLGYIYTSEDSGATWTQRTGAGSRRWSSITSSSDGIKLVACEKDGYIYTSEDSGATWTQRASAGSRRWSSITSSLDGMTLAASVHGGYIYTSQDGGATWIQRTTAGSNYWSSITSSSDGTRFTACADIGYIYTAVYIPSPQVSTANVSEVTSTTAISGGDATADDGAVVTEKGVCWNTSPNPTISNNRTNEGEGAGIYTSNITGLFSGTTYYLRSYAKGIDDIVYGNEIVFTTNIGIPVVTTNTIISITVATAVSGGNVISDGGANVTSRGVCWGTTENPTIADSHTTNGTGTGIFTSNLTGLTPNTIYHVRAYAVNSEGVSYGNDRLFTTNPIVIPTVTTLSVTSITTATAVSGGNVISDGGANVTSRGVCWGTTENPTIADSHTTNGTGTGIFTSNLTGLTPNTIYHVRAYAVNSIGVSYGNDRLFTTNPIVLPTVITSSVSSITTATAVSGGYVTSDGGANVTSRGVCWGTTENPTIADSHTANGTGTGIFTSNLTGLTPNTIYHVRAYAVNSLGVSYGNDRSITTNPIVLPTLATSFTTSITRTSALSGGNVTSDGGANVTVRGVCWSTSANPTIIDSHTTDGAGTGSYASNITGLTPNTIYYVRAYATNNIGTTYGNESVFKTMDISVPSVSTTAVSSITSTTAVSGGNVTSDGGANVTARGVCWRTSENPTITDRHTTNGTGTGSFTSNLIELTPSTAYYVRSYATNSKGTGYGSIYTFTTKTAINLVSLPEVIVTASSYYNENYAPDKAADGIYGAWDEYEWASNGEMAPWIDFIWGEAHTINKVVLYDRCNPVDHISDAWLYLKKDGGVVKAIHVGMFPFGGSAKEVIFDPVNIDEIYLDITDGWGLNVGLSEMQVFYDINTNKLENAASSAKYAVASSEYSMNYSADKAFDGIYGAWDEYEWASSGEMNPYLFLSWCDWYPDGSYNRDVHLINKIVLYDRCNPVDHIEDAWLHLCEYGDIVRSIHIGMFPFGGSAKEILFDPIYVDGVFLDIVDGWGLNVGLSEMQVFYDPEIETKTNLVASANVTASSYYNNAYNPNMAKDGIYGAWDEYEWASKGEMTPWIDFRWNEPHTINKVVLYDRCNPVDHISDAWMYLKKDGGIVKAIHVGMFPFGGAAKEINFDPVSVDEIYLDITSGWGLNVGLSEMQVFEE